MNIIFDYDGTLHNCLKIYAPAFRSICDILASDGLLESRTYTDEEIGSWLGLPFAEMWAGFAPNITENDRNRASNHVYHSMISAITNGQAELYPGATEMLQKLKNDGHKLYFLSNCRHNYMEAHSLAFNLSALFDEMYCAEDFAWHTKAEIYPEIKAAHPGDFVMVGDRRHDMEVAEVHNIPAIGCAYGYGSPDELAITPYIAQTVSDIPTLIEKLGK